MSAVTSKHLKGNCLNRVSRALGGDTREQSWDGGSYYWGYQKGSGGSNSKKRKETARPYHYLMGVFGEARRAFQLRLQERTSK